MNTLVDPPVKNRSHLPEYISKTLIAVVGAIGIIGGAIGGHYFTAQDAPKAAFELWSPPANAAEPTALDLYRYDKLSGRTWKLKVDTSTGRQVWLAVEELAPPPAKDMISSPSASASKDNR